MLRFAIVILLALSMPAAASQAQPSLIAQGTRITIQIFTEPCAAKIAAQVPAEYRAAFQRAVITRDGVAAPGCWAAGGETVFVVNEAGEIGKTPIGAYRPVTGT